MKEMVINFKMVRLGIVYVNYVPIHIILFYILITLFYLKK